MTKSKKNVSGSRNLFAPLRILLLLLVLTSITGFAVGSDTRASSSDIEWIDPYNPENKDEPAHFQDGSEIAPRVELRDSMIGNDPGQVEWMQKKSFEKSYSRIYSVEIKERFHHGQSGLTPDIPANGYLLQDEQSFTVTEGETKTVTIDGADHEIEAEIVDPTNNPKTATTRIDGGDLYETFVGEYFYIQNVPVRVYDIKDSITGDYVEYQVYDDTYEPQTGSYDLKAKAEVDDQEYFHSRPLHFDLSINDGQNIPYVKSLSYDGKEIDNLNTETDIEIGDTVVATVEKQESDPYNVTLVDRSTGTKISKAEVASDGTIESFYDLIVEGTLGIFFDVSGFQSGDTAEIPLKLTPEQNDNIDFLSTVNGEYQLGIKIEEFAGTRNTPDYTLQTNQDNSPPSIDSVEASADCSSYQDITSFNNEENLVECIRVSASDSDTDASNLGVSLNLIQEYDGVKHYETTEYTNYDSRNNYNYIFNVSKADVPFNEFNNSGSWTADVEVTDGLDSATDSITWTVPWGTVNVEMVRPSTNISKLNNESFDFDLRISCSGGPECVNQNESINVYWDPVKSSSKGLIQNLQDYLIKGFA
ncbi:MAG: hypothetical protein V5A72_03190 [Candidatus Nanohaloarchaea archaeon]